MRNIIIILALAFIVSGVYVALKEDGAPAVVPNGSDESLPRQVEERRQMILDAAERGDYAALAALATPPFNYTFGGEVEGGFIAFLQREGQNHTERIATLLKGPYGKIGNIYVWPRAFAETPEYYDWRLGIREDGKWLYYIAGD